MGKVKYLQITMVYSEDLRFILIDIMMLRGLMGGHYVFK